MSTYKKSDKYLKPFLTELQITDNIFKTIQLM